MQWNLVPTIYRMTWSSLDEGEDGLHLPKLFNVVLRELYLLFWHFINMTAYCFGLMWAFISSLSSYPWSGSSITYASCRRDSSELVDDIPWQEVDVVVAERDAGVADTLAVEKVQLAVVYPKGTLKVKDGGILGWFVSLTNETLIDLWKRSS